MYLSRKFMLNHLIPNIHLSVYNYLDIHEFLMNIRIEFCLNFVLYRQHYNIFESINSIMDYRFNFQALNVIYHKSYVEFIQHFTSVLYHKKYIFQHLHINCAPQEKKILFYFFEKTTPKLTSMIILPQRRE